jgi:hypothetical protein
LQAWDNKIHSGGDGAVFIIDAAALALGMYFGLKSDNEVPTASLDLPEGTRPIPSTESELGIYWNAAVTTNGYPCAIISRLVGRHFRNAT